MPFRRLVALVVLSAALAAGAARAEAPQPGVLIIGDSVATGMLWHDDAIAVVQRGYDVEWQVAICRTTVGPGCPFEGERPESLLDLVDTRPSVPPTVVVVTGYNDPEPTFAAAVDTTVDDLVARGAKSVLWLTLRASEPPFPDLNAILADAITRHPQLHLVDWDSFSAPHPDWFQTDGVHLLPQGGLAMAHLVHGNVTELLDPLRPAETKLPPVRRGRRYAASLRVLGGTPPYRFRVVAGRLGAGLSLHPNGRITGVPRQTSPLLIQAEVVDADGMSTLVDYGSG